MYQKSQSYDVKLQRYKVRQTEFFIILGHFLPFYSPCNDPKNQNSWRYYPFIHIYMCTINEDHMIYGSWNKRCNRQEFLWFRVICCPFSPLTTQKIKILKFRKTFGDMIILYICNINDNHVRYGSWDMEPNRQPFFVILDHFLPFYPPLDPENQNFDKMKKNPWRYYNFTHVYQKWQSYDVWFLRYGAWWT